MGGPDNLDLNLEAFQEAIRKEAEKETEVLREASEGDK